MCLGILPALLILYVRRSVEDPEVFPGARTSAARATSCRSSRSSAPTSCKTTVAASLLATGIQGGYYAMFTWIPTYLKTERGLTVVGTSGYLFVVIAGAFVGYLTAGLRPRPARARARRSRCSRRWRASSLVAVLPRAVGLEHDAADRRLPAGVLRLGLLLGLRLLPVRAVSRRGRAGPAGASVTTSAAASARCSRASSASSRRPSGSAARSPSACSATCSRSSRWRCCRRPTGASSRRSSDELADALRGARVYDLEQPRYAGAPVFPAHEPGVLLHLHRRHERGRSARRARAPRRCW